MIIDIIVILKLYLIIYTIDNGSVRRTLSVFGTHVRIRIPCVILWKNYIPLDKLYIIDESIRQLKLHYL